MRTWRLASRIQGADRDLPGLTERLAEAIERAGGATAVARKSGVPLRTLNHYLAGTGLKIGTLVALAEACGVSVEWLATGRTPIGHNNPPPEVIGPPPDVKLFSIVHMGRLGNCVQGALKLIEEAGKVGEWEDVVRIAIILYDQKEVTKPGGVP